MKEEEYLETFGRCLVMAFPILVFLSVVTWWFLK